MKRLALRTVVVAVAALMLSSPARAQYVFFGAGPTFPLGDYKDVATAKTGYTFLAGFGAEIGSKGLFLEAEIGRGTNQHENSPPNINEKTNVISAFGALGMKFGAAEKKVKPFLLAGAGLVAHQFRTDAEPPLGEGTESKFGVTGAAGVAISLDENASVLFEGRYIGASGTSLMGVIARLVIGL